jgi:hypothetical protein
MAKEAKTAKTPGKKNIFPALKPAKTPQTHRNVTNPKNS